MPDIKSQNIVILDVEDGATQKKEESTLTYIKNFFANQGSITMRQKVIFFRILATMVNASLTVLSSMKALRKQEKDKNMIKFYDYMIHEIQTGKPMNAALNNYYGCFNDAEVSIIEAGERTGKLNSALLQIAEQTEKIDSIKRKIKGAMTYPALLVVGMVGSMSVLMIKVIPTITGFFADDPSKLPQATQTILAISDFLKNSWYIVVIAAVVAFIAIKVWKRTKSGRYRWDYIMLHLPIYWPLVKQVILSRFARVFSNLLGSGVAVVEAIRIVSGAVDNEVYRQRILLLKQDIKNGQKIAESIEDDPLFPDLLVSMIRVGEETAQIGNTVIKIADFYDEEVDIAIGSIQKLIEPVIMVIMAVAVWFLAVGIFQPIMGIAGTIGG